MERSQSERLWMVGGGIVALVAVLIGYFFFIGPQRSETDDVNGQIDGAKSQNAALSLHITQLQAQSRNLPKYEAQLAAARKALPDTSGISDFLRTLQSIGAATLTDVNSVTIGTPVDASGATANAAPGGATPSASTAAPKPGGSGSSNASNSSNSSPNSTGASVYGLSITAQASGTPAALNKFLEQLQTVQPRAVLISEIVEGAGATGPGSVNAPTTLELSLEAFVAPSTPAETAQLAAAATTTPSK